MDRVAEIPAGGRNDFPAVLRDCALLRPQLGVIDEPLIPEKIRGIVGNDRVGCQGLADLRLAVGPAVPVVLEECDLSGDTVAGDIATVFQSGSG